MIRYIADIIKAIEVLKNNKYPVKNMIGAKLLKKGRELIVNDMWELIKTI